MVGNKKIEQKVKKGTIKVDEVEKDYAAAPAEGIEIAEGDKAVKVVKKKGAGEKKE
jgi:hypothetical protein